MSVRSSVCVVTDIGNGIGKTAFGEERVERIITLFSISSLSWHVKNVSLLDASSHLNL